MEVTFIKGGESVYFPFMIRGTQGRDQFGLHGIPRVGERVEVRQFIPREEQSGKDVDVHMVGRVKEVEWYFSSGNHGQPCVRVYLE